jgi:hypothetical protein
MPWHIRDSDVSRMRLMVMKALKQETHNDETVAVNKHSIFDRACSNDLSPGEKAHYNSDIALLKSLVFQDLLDRGDIREGDLDQIQITYQGKNRSEYY